MSDHDLASVDSYSRHLREAQAFAAENADFISLHNDSDAAHLAALCDKFLRYDQPTVCTESTARTRESRFAASMPVLKKNGIGAYNWGFVSGKSQTIFPWRSAEGAPEQPLWFHDVLRPDGTPFDPEETALIQRLTAR